MFSTVYNRYLLTHEEKITTKTTVKSNQALTIRNEASRKSFVLNLNDATFILLDLDLKQSSPTVTLHSNQMRGKACNAGFFANRLIHNPTLIFKNTTSGKTIRTVIASGFTGSNEVITPITQELKALKPGQSYKVSFEAREDAYNPARPNMKPIFKQHINLGQITLPTTKPNTV